MNALDRGSKEIIGAFPTVGEALSESGIACVTCNVGTCRLKDIVTMHNLSPEAEDRLLVRIGAIVCPGEKLEIPEAERKARAAKAQRRLSPPMQRLVEEHAYIKRVLALIPRLATDLPNRLDARRQDLAEVLDFIRGYADTYHHAKEEDILFGFFDPKAEVILAFRQEHEIGRGHVRAAAAALENGDARAVAEHLTAYGELLREHIRKEDEILYPWMDGSLPDSDVGRLYARFAEVDERFGGKPAAFETLVARLEKEA